MIREGIKFCTLHFAGNEGSSLGCLSLLSGVMAGLGNSGRATVVAARGSNTIVCSRVFGGF